VRRLISASSSLSAPIEQGQSLRPRLSQGSSALLSQTRKGTRKALHSKFLQRSTARRSARGEVLIRARQALRFPGRRERRRILTHLPIPIHKPASANDECRYVKRVNTQHTCGETRFPSTVCIEVWSVGERKRSAHHHDVPSSLSTRTRRTKRCESSTDCE